MRKYKVEEVAVLIGCASPTINKWYRYKKAHPEDILFQTLPDYEQDGDRQTRYWSQDAIYKLSEFQLHIPRGRLGIMGKYHGKGTKNGYKEDHKEAGK